jgi:regulator of protease activity HflC (stomatin/prohibitin superfamily)
MRPTLLLGLIGLLGLTACGNPATPAGYVGYLTRGAIVGKASYVGLQTGPTSYGASWLVKVMNVSVTPFSYAEDFTGENAVLTKDKLLVSFRAHTIFRVRGDKVKEFIEQYTTLGEGPNQVQVAFGNYLKEPLRTQIRESVAHFDAFPLNENIGRISNELTTWAQEKTKNTPFEVLNVVVGNLQYPAVVAQAVSNKLAVSQDLETRATQVEIARKDAERRVVEAEGIARATQIIQQRLTPLYIQHEAIEAQKAMVGSPNHSVIYIPVGPMGVPIVNVAPSPGNTAPAAPAAPAPAAKR